MRPITIRGKPGRMPLLCAPLVAATRDALLSEAAVAVEARPDIVEWRVDHYRDVGNAAAVIESGRALRQALREIPVLFTCRSVAEGGNPIPIDDRALVALYSEVCASGCVDLADYEMSKPAADMQAVREATRRHGVGLVCSFHDFQRTPPAGELLGHYRRAKALGGDVAKVSVMAQHVEDSLALLGATLQAAREIELPLIAVSMGPHGALSRVMGFAFGSALTFGVAAKGSAPGQMPIAELRTAIEIARKAMHG